MTRTNPPFSSFPQFFAGDTTRSVPDILIQDAFASGTATPATPIIEALDTNIQNGYQQQASLGIQHQFGSGFVAEIDYNWQKNTKFLAYRNLNAPVQTGTFLFPYPQFGPI